MDNVSANDPLLELNIESLRVLVVDDSPDDIELLTDLLTESQTLVCQVDSCASARVALQRLRDGAYDCMLIDYNMPGEDGFWVLAEVQLEDIETPIIMMTGEGDERLAVKALKSGAQDYISKTDLSLDILTESIGYAIKRKREDLEFLQRVKRDQLTGAVSRYALHDELEHVLIRAKRSGRSFAVLFLDLNKFKQVNDTYGHDVGDLVLRDSAQRILKCLRDSDTLGRYGGDEFVIILEDVMGNAQTAGSESPVIERIHASITDKPYCRPRLNLELGVSIGVAVYPYSGSSPQALIRAADKAMYECKKLPGTRYLYDAASRVAME